MPLSRVKERMTKRHKRKIGNGYVSVCACVCVWLNGCENAIK